MIVCKICVQTFNSTSRLPYIFSCGHTFCKSCIDTCFNKVKHFSCVNCFHKTYNPNESFVNQILIDKTSYIVIKGPNVARESISGFSSSSFKKASISQTSLAFEDTTDKTFKSSDIEFKEDESTVTFASTYQNSNWSKCRMRHCKEAPTNDGVCKRCNAGLVHVGQLRMQELAQETDEEGVNIGTPKVLGRSHNKSTMSSFSDLLYRRSFIDERNKATVKRRGEVKEKVNGLCQNNGCLRIINEGDRMRKYCGFVCRHEAENNKLNF